MTSAKLDRDAYELIMRAGRATLRDFFEQFFDLVQKAHGAQEPALALATQPGLMSVERLAPPMPLELLQHPAIKTYGRLQWWGWRIAYDLTPARYAPGVPIVLRRGKRLKSLFVETTDRTVGRNPRP